MCIVKTASATCLITKSPRGVAQHSTIDQEPSRSCTAQHSTIDQEPNRSCTAQHSTIDQEPNWSCTAQHSTIDQEPNRSCTGLQVWAVISALPKLFTAHLDEVCVETMFRKGDFEAGHEMQYISNAYCVTVQHSASFCWAAHHS